MEFIKQPESQIPVYFKSEVIVVGGGVAGLSAAVAAARLGCKTILIENGGFLGGTVTKCLMPIYGQGDPPLIKGFFDEFCGRMRKAGALLESEKHASSTPVDPEIFKAVCFDFAMEAGVELLLHTMVINIIRDRAKLSGVIIANKSGIQAITGDIIIDASGDADIAFMAGETFETDGERQPMSLMFSVGNVDAHRFADWVKNYPDKKEFWPSTVLELDREKVRINVGGFYGLIKKARESGELDLPHDNMALIFLPMPGVVGVNATHVTKLNPLNAKEVTLGEIVSRKQMLSVFNFLKKHIPGFENAFINNSAGHIGIRESRRVSGEYVLKEEDIRNARQFNDAIALYHGRASIHGPGEKQTFLSFPKSYQIPYRSLQPKLNGNMLVAGRCISADHVAHAAVRSVSCSFATGQAAGTAAALAVQKNINPKELDVSLLRKSLAEQGVLLAEPA